MSNKGKKFAAAMAAVQQYLQEEEDALAQAELAAQATAVAPSCEAGQWAQSGRIEMMAGRRMIQLRAFSNIR
ncbi:MAG: hypothetical protein QM739_02025 [Propionivibrio sp.]